MMQAFFSINNFKSHKKVTESFFSIKNFETVMMSFLSFKSFQSNKKVIDSFFSGRASLSFHMMHIFPRAIFYLSVLIGFL